MHAMTTLKSRSFSWGPAADKFVLVPGLDLINHDSHVPNRYEYTDSQRLRYVAPHSLRPGNELFIAYRPHASNSHLLSEYGFVIPRLTEDFTLIRLSTSLVSRLTHALELSMGDGAEPLDIDVHAVVSYDDHVPTPLLRALDLLAGGKGEPSQQAYDQLLQVLDREIASFGRSFDAELLTLARYQQLRDKQGELTSLYRVEAQRLLRNIRAGVRRDRDACRCRAGGAGSVAMAIGTDGSVNETDTDACGPCEVTARWTLKMVKDETAMRVLVIGKDEGDDFDIME
jgi:hypothetical protein